MLNIKVKLLVIFLAVSSTAIAQTPTLSQASINVRSQLNTTDSQTSITNKLSQPAGAGDLLAFLLTTTNSSAANITITDNGTGGTDSYTLPSGGQCNTGSGYYAYLVYTVVNSSVSGLTAITASYSGGPYNFLQMSPILDFHNVSTTPLDQASCTNLTGATTLGSALTTLSASNELITLFTTVNNGTAESTCNLGSNANITWTAQGCMVADQNSMIYVQSGIYSVTTAFTPSMTVPTSTNAFAVAAAWKPGSSGTTPGSGLYVIHAQHDNTANETAATVFTEYPVAGNTLRMEFSSGCTGTTLASCYYPTSVSCTGGLTWTQLGSNIFDNLETSGSGGVTAVWYADAPTAGYYPCQWTMNTRTSGNGATFMYQDISGAANPSTDTSFGSSGVASMVGCQCSGSGPVATFTATPGNANELVFVEISIAFDTITGITSPTSQTYYIACNYITESEPSHCDENNGWANYLNASSLSSITPTWSHDTSDDTFVGDWVALGVAVKPSSAMTTTGACSSTLGVC